jgi:hypothetical protein
MTTTHAPSSNFAIAKIKTTANDTNAEVPLTMIPRIRCGPVPRRWCATMPMPAMVNPVNTPIA